MAVYVDGSALSRFLLDVPGGAQWRAWAAEHLDQLVTTPLGLSELRRLSMPLGHDAREAAWTIADRIREIRFSDQAMKTASMVSGVLSPFAALHLGVAVSEPDVDALATYDPLLAATGALYRLRIITPGRHPMWWER